MKGQPDSFASYTLTCDTSLYIVISPLILETNVTMPVGEYLRLNIEPSYNHFEYLKRWHAKTVSVHYHLKQTKYA